MLAEVSKFFYTQSILLFLFSTMLPEGLTYIEIDDEITDVFSKISSSKETVLYLVIPARSLLLTSIVNLKLIHKRATDEKKTVIIVTQDKIGRTLASQAGLTAVKDYKDMAENTLDVQPRTLSETKLVEDKKTPRLDSVSLWEKFLYLLGFYKYDEESARYRMVFAKPSKKAYVTLLLFSVLILFTVVIFGLPDARIRITPKMEMKPVDTNITFVKSATSIDQKQVHMETLEVSYDKVFNQPTTGGVFKGTNAHGIVKIYNKSTKPWPIVPNSRLQTSEGLVFLTTKFVSVPAGGGDTPGTLDVDVEAREKDANNQFIGDRGNIGPTKFTLPGLSSSNQQLIYAESTSTLSGGTTNVDRFVTKEDVDIANKNIIQELKNMAPEVLQATLQKNIPDAAHFEIFEIHDDRFVSADLLSIEIPRDIIGKKMDGFEVRGKMRAKAFYFKKSEIEKILADYFINHKLTAREKILRMDETSLRFGDVLSTPQDPEVKVTASMNGLYTYSFDKDQDTLVKTIQSHLTGVKKEDAEKYIQNMGTVDHVTIQLSPVWQKTLPAIKESITIEIVEPK